MRPADYQPPLTWWSHTWRLLVMLGLSGLSFASSIDDHVLASAWWVGVDLAVGVVTYVLVWWRRSYPIAVTTLVNLASIVSVSSIGPGALALVSLSTRRRWREIVPESVLAVGCGLIAGEFVLRDDATPRLVAYTLVIVGVAAMVAWGLYVGSRRELLASLRARAALAEQQQRSEVAKARAVERAQIAREMHDVVAHRISTVSMYAGILTYRTDLSPAEVRRTASTIQENSYRALTELREVLGVLREGPGDATPELPQVGLDDITTLVQESRAAGMRLTFSSSADLEVLSANTIRTLYRCLQEGLTNARKHASASTVSVRITSGRSDRDGGSGPVVEGIDLLVANPLSIRPHPEPPPPSGLGLIGVSERVALVGGRSSATRTDDGMFLLHVWLPAKTRDDSNDGGVAENGRGRE